MHFLTIFRIFFFGGGIYSIPLSFLTWHFIFASLLPQLISNSEMKAFQFNNKGCIILLLQKLKYPNPNPNPSYCYYLL